MKQQERSLTNIEASFVLRNTLCVDAIAPFNSFACAAPRANRRLKCPAYLLRASADVVAI